LRTRHTLAKLTEGGDIEQTSLLSPDLQPAAGYLGSNFAAQLKDWGYNVLAKKCLGTVQTPDGVSHHQDRIVKYKDALLTQALTLPKFGRLYEAGKIAISLSPESVDFVPAGWHKGKGVEAFLTKNRLDPQKALAVGDAEGDIPMMEVCGYAAAPADATKVVNNYLATRNNGFSAQMQLSLGTMQILKAYGDMISSRQTSWPKPTLHRSYARAIDNYEAELK
jgi:hypothetical protein